ncbi:polymorphic toxin-type HINT domain-containing protein [Hymenobacter arcticus]
MPAPLLWQDAYPAKVGGADTLLFRSCITCPLGQGKIEFMTSGQLPIPPELSQQLKETKQEANETLKQAELEKNSVGEAGLLEGAIPIWGSGRDLIHAAQTGDKVGVALNAAFLVWDIVSVAAGVVSFGAATVAMAGAKAGVRGLLKAGGKVAVGLAKKQLERLAAKSLALKAGLKNIRPFLAKIPRICVTACFPAGTPVAVAGGYKNIEELQVGELVWAWHEETGDLALKPVLQTLRREADALVELQVGADTVQATPEHPFWANGGWTDAGNLVKGDELLRSDGLTMPVGAVTHRTQQPTTVYNVEVADWHTYLVSWWMFVVHNTKICFAELTALAKKAAREWIEANRKQLTNSVTEEVVGHSLEMADDAQKISSKVRPGVAGAMELKDGTVMAAHSQTGLTKGVLPENLHKKVKKVLNDIPEKLRSEGHGKCAEPQIITQALNDGKDLKGAKSVAMEVRGKGNLKHALPKCACNSCKILLEHFGIEDVVKSLE